MTRRPGFSGGALAWVICFSGALQLLVSGQDVAPPGPAAGASKPAETKKDGAVESPWSAGDTRLANQYIALLQQQPEYGNVLDLLWNLYQKRGQGELLLQYFESTAGPQGSPLGHLLYGHLLRKNEDLDGAKKHYEVVIKAVPQQKDALRGVAEILESQGQKARALSSYVRLVEIVPPGTEEGVALRLRLASLLRETGQIEQSVRIWEEVLEAHPGEVKLRTEVVGLLLEANRTPEAAKILESVVKDGTVEQRIDALRELARLHEFVNDFDASASADRRGMALAHFRNYVHEEFFTRLVRLYERFGRLVELETELKKPAEMEHPGEREVYLMAEYYRLTARQPDRIAWTRRLVELVPASVDYRLQLASLLLDSDQNEEADGLLAKLIAEQPDPPLPLILLRVQATIRQSGKAAAGALLAKYLDDQTLADDSMRRVLDFSREYYLDDIVERILREHGLVAAAQAGESTPFEVELAKFHRERGRTREAIETLQRWVAQTGVGLQDRVARLHLAARTLRDQGLSEQAGQMLEQIIT
ncbi:MAG: tetratricopeptide repeat protein, partial [Verrucomicrobiales bacterium]